MVICQPLTRRGRQQGGLIRRPGAERLGLLHAPFSQADPLQSLQSGRIQGRLWNAARGSRRDRLLEHRFGDAHRLLQRGVLQPLGHRLRALARVLWAGEAMAQVLIRQLDNHVVAALKARAQAHRRPQPQRRRPDPRRPRWPLKPAPGWWMPPWPSAGWRRNQLVLVQLLNAAWKSLRLGAITAAQFDWLAHRGGEPFTALFPSQVLLARARHWCSLLDHPAYDCLTIALAEQQNATLITADQRLLRKLQEPHPGLPSSLDLARLS